MSLTKWDKSPAHKWCYEQVFTGLKKADFLKQTLTLTAQGWKLKRDFFKNIKTPCWTQTFIGNV